MGKDWEAAWRVYLAFHMLDGPIPLNFMEPGDSGCRSIGVNMWNRLLRHSNSTRSLRQLISVSVS